MIIAVDVRFHDLLSLRGLVVCLSSLIKNVALKLPK